MKKRFVLFLVLFIVSGAAVAEERFIKPVDNAKQDASFLAFRTKLVAAAERKDANAILAILDPKIQLSFGGDSGIADFKRIWKITDKNSDFWPEFLTIIKNGGSFSKEGRTRQFVAPYTFSDWPENLDGFDYYAIFGNNVNLRDKPSMDGKLIGSLSYNIVKVDNDKSILDNDAKEEDRKFVWYKVKTLGGKEGFVKAEFVRSPIDYRAGFEKKRGVWKMTFFLAGD